MAYESNIVSQRPRSTADLVRRLMSNEIKQDEKDALYHLTENMLQIFATDSGSLYGPEAAALAPILQNRKPELSASLIDSLGNTIIQGTADGNIINVNILRSLAYVLWHTENLALSDVTLGSVLRSLLTRLQNAKEAGEPKTQYLTVCSISAILDTMVDLKAAGLGREGLHEPLLKELKELRTHDDLRLATAAAYTYQALLGVKDDESAYKALWRYSKTGVKIATSIATAATINPAAIIPAASSILDMLQYLIKDGQDIAEFMSSLCDIKEWKEGVTKFSKQKRWYRALRYTDLLIQSDAWSTLEAFLQVVPCRDDEQFRCGLLVQIETLWISASREPVQVSVHDQARRLYERQHDLPNNSTNELRWHSILDQRLSIVRPSRLPLKKGSNIMHTKLQPFIRRPQSDSLAINNDHQGIVSLLEKGWEASTLTQIFYADAAIREYYTMYDRLHVERISGERLSLEKCYINLIITKKDISSSDRVESTNYTYWGRLKACKHEGDEKSIDLRALFGDREGLNMDNEEDSYESHKEASNETVIPRRIFIEGRAGIGKTTLCKKIVHEFLSNRLGHGLFDRILWLPLRKLSTRSGSFDWQELFVEEYLYHVNAQDRTLFARALSTSLDDLVFQGRSLMLLDGLDEIAQNRTVDDPVYKFLRKVVAMPSVIITSRPQGQVFDIGKFDLQLETVGFRMPQVKDYLLHCIPDKNSEEKIRMHLRDKPILLELVRVPIQLDALCYVWTTPRFTFDELDTMTCLFQRIFIELCRKDVLRLEKEHQVHDLEDFEIETLMQAELEFLQGFAFQGLVNTIIEFSARHQKQLASHMSALVQRLKTPFKQSLEKMSFLRTSGTERGLRDRPLHFLHLTTQEFFAARHFVKYWKEDKPLVCLDLSNNSTPRISTPQDFLMQERYNSRYNIFWRFVTGLVQLGTELGSEKNLSELFRDFESPPQDFLGFSHPRLLMYTLSEVTASNNEADCQLRIALEDKLVNWTIFENRTISKASRYRDIPSRGLAYQTEFPENAVQRILSYSETLFIDICRGRDHISSTTLKLMTNLLSHPSEHICSEASWKLHIRQDLRIRAIDDIISLIRQKDDARVQKRTKFVSMLSRVLGGFSRSLPAQALTSLVRLLTDKDVGQRIAECINYQPNLPQEVVIDILQLVARSDLAIQVRAAELLHKLFNHPQSVDLVQLANNADIKSLLRRSLMLAPIGKGMVAISTQFIQDDDASLRRNCIWLICSQKGPDLPDEVVSAQDIIVCDKDPGVRQRAAEALRFAAPLSQRSQRHLVTLLGDSNVDVRTAAIETLDWSVGNYENVTQRLLDTSVFTALLEIMLNKSDISKTAAKAIGSNRLLPSEVLQQLEQHILGHDPEIRRLAVISLRSCLCLSRNLLDILVDLLSNTEDNLCHLAADVLQNGYLPREVTTAIARHFESASPVVRAATVEALFLNKDISEDALVSLVSLLFDVEGDVADRAFDMLKRRDELPTSICRLLSNMAINSEDSVKTMANEILNNQLNLLLVVEHSEGQKETTQTLMHRLQDRHFGLDYMCSVVKQRKQLLPQNTIAGLVAVWTDEVMKQRDLNARETLNERPYPRLIKDIAQILGSQHWLPVEAIEAIIPSHIDDVWTMYSASMSIADHIVLPPRAMDNLIHILTCYQTEKESKSRFSQSSLSDVSTTIWEGVRIFVKHTIRGEIPVERVINVLNSLTDLVVRDRVVSGFGWRYLLFQFLDQLREDVWKSICKWWVVYAISSNTSCYVHLGQLYFLFGAKRFVFSGDAKSQDRFLEILKEALEQRDGDAAIEDDATEEQSLSDEQEDMSSSDSD